MSSVRHWLGVIGLGLVLAGSAGAETWRVEAELAGDGTVEKIVPGISNEVVRWKVTQEPQASGGACMAGMITAETRPVATRIPKAGAYRVWVRHYQTVGKPTSFFILFRDDQDAGAGLRYIDFHPRPKIVTALPESLPEAPADAKPQWAWSVCDYTFERAMDVTVSFGPSGGLVTGKQAVDCVVITDDTSFDPNAADWSALPTEPGPIQPARVPRGFEPALPYTLHSSFFAGSPNRDEQIKLTMVHGYTLYRDYSTFLQLGFNRDRGHGAGSAEYGVQTQISPHHVQYFAVNDLLRQVAPPEGRRVGADGTVRDKRFSLAYEPYRKVLLESLKKGIELTNDMEEAERYAVVGESGGVFDYSDLSRNDFHRWLEKQHGNIDTLNERWRTSYKSFAEIPLPQAPKPEDNKAAWFAFRQYSSQIMCEQVAEEVRVVNEVDKAGRQATSQASCLHINSPWFTSTGPLDFEDLITIGFAESKMFGYDAYSSEDGFVGCDLEFLLSLAGDREVLNGEGNTHAQDPRIAGRSFWSQIAKGVKGIDIWQLQDHPLNPVYTMWGMLFPDMTPRPKLGAIADAAHEVHRLEWLLKPAKRQRQVKPVALYYSRMDLSLSQPLLDIYGASIDSPYHVYMTLRGLGYPVRWITPRQIEAGELEKVGAVVLVGVKYVPGEASRRLADWVAAGGCIIGDQWPGAFDEYDRPQGTLAEVFGIRAVEEQHAKMTPEELRIALAEQETPVYGLDPKVLRSMEAADVYRNVSEMFWQRDSNHPVAKAAGTWHLAGYGPTSVHVVSGEIIGQLIHYRPGVVINQHGKGHALYSALMLGTLYEAGPIRFEWDSSRSGPGLGNLLDAYLRYCGLEPFAQADLPLGVARKLRVEEPLVDARGNAFIGVVSVNDGPLSPFDLTLRWSDSAPRPKIVLAAVNGSRRLEQVPFKIESGRLRVTVPGFDTHASLLALTDSVPLVGLEFTGVPRTTAGLLEVNPNARMKVTATIWNPSDRKLDRGVIRLHAAPGWAVDDSEEKVSDIAAFGHKTVSFELVAPELCAATALRPIVVRYQSGDHQSTPATELVWWTAAEVRR